MSTKNLSVQIEAVVKGLSQVQNLGKHLQDVAKHATTAGSGLNAGAAGAGVFSDGAAKAAQSLTSFLDRSDQVNQSILTMTGYLKTAIAGFIAFAGVSAGKAAADLAARNETLGNTLEVIGFNAGYSTEELQKYENEVKKIGVTTQVARDTITQFIRAGIDIGPAFEGGVSRVSELTRAAQNLARATGQNTSETLQRLVLNIQQLDTVGLRFIGVTVNSEQAFAAYGQQIGKAASALSTAEKQQALMNEVVKQGAGIAGVYEKSLETVGGQIQSMKRYQEEAAAQIGRIFLPAYSELVKAATSFLKEVQSIATAIADSGVAAETLRSIMRTALDFGTAVAASIKGALQSVAPAVLNLVDRVRDAFSTFDLKGVTQASSQALQAISSVVSSVINVVASASMEFRALAEGALLVFQSISKVIQSFAALINTQDSVAAGSTALRTVLTVIGYLLAGLADGATLFGAAVQQAIGLAAFVLGSLAEKVGGLVSYMFPNLGKSIEEVGKRMLDFGERSTQSANKTVDGFKNGDTALARFRESLENMTVEYGKFNNAAKPTAQEQEKAFKTASEAVRKYAEEVRKGTLTSEQATQRYAKVKEEVQALADKYGFTDAQIKQLNTSLDQSKTKGEDVSKAYADLKISATELGTGLSDAGGRAVKAFEQIATQAGISGQQISKAFATALDSETSVKGLTRFKQSIEKLFADGKISATEYQEALGRINIKFGDLTEAALKSAKTAGDFEELTRAIKEVGDAGTVSGAYVGAALDKVSEKARGARAEAKRLAEDFRAATGSSANIAEADLKASKAALDVSKSRLSVEKAQQEYQANRTVQTKAALDLAKAEYNLAQQNAKQAQLEAQQTSASEQALAAQRELERAKEAAERKPADEHAQRMLQNAQQQYETKQNESTVAQGMVNIQRQQVAQSQQQVALAQAGLDKAKQQADVEAGKAAAHQAFLQGLLASYQVINNASKTLTDVGYSINSAREMADLVRRTAYANTGTIEDMVKALAQGERMLAKMVAQANEQKSRAAEIGQAFSKAKDEAQKLEDAVAGIPNSTKQAVTLGEVYTAQMREVRREAEAINRSAAQAAMSFVKGLGSIKEELLQAQGREEEAAKLRFESRRRELRLEYDMLRVKLLGAKLTAEAAGIDTANITQAMRELDSGFSEAIRDLDKLEDLERSRRREEKRRNKEREAETQSQQRTQEATDPFARSSSATQQTSAPVEDWKGPALSAQALAAKEAEAAIANAVSGTLSVAQGAAVAATEVADAVAAQQPKPEKTIRVELAAGRDRVTATLRASDETDLLRILEQAKGVS